MKIEVPIPEEFMEKEKKEEAEAEEVEVEAPPVLLQHMSKKAPTFREEMNCQPQSLSIQAISKSVPMGSGELTPDKPIKKGVRWNKTSGLEGHDGGTVDEAGTSTFRDERMSAMYGPSRKNTICVVNRNGKTYYRAYREDAENPSPYQILARIALGEVGKKATGTEMTGELPPAAALVREKLTGAYFGQTYHPRKWETLLSSYSSYSSD